MAITIIQTPAAMQPVYNPLIFLVSSSNSGQPNYRTIAEIKNSAGTVLAKLKLPLIPGTARSWVDVHRILENYVTHDLGVTTYTALESDSSWFEYSVSFGEEYGTTPTEHLGLTSSGALRVFNASLDLLDDITSYDQTDWVTARGTSEGRWLSCFQTTKPVALDQNDWLSYITDSGSSPSEIQVVATLANGSTQTSRFAAPLAGSGLRVYRLPSGPANINQATLSTGTQPAIPDTAVSYTVQLYKNIAPAGAYGPVMSYKIKSALSVHTPADLYFLNSAGAFESWRMDMRHDSSHEITRQTYDQTLISHNASGPSMGWDADAGSGTIYDTRISKKIRMVSDWVTPEENQALLDLISSPLVYLHMDGKIRQILITTSTHQEHLRVNDKIKSLEIQATFSVRNRRQSR